MMIEDKNQDDTPLKKQRVRHEVESENQIVSLDNNINFTIKWGDSSCCYDSVIAIFVFFLQLGLLSEKSYSQSCGLLKILFSKPKSASYLQQLQENLICKGEDSNWMILWNDVLKNSAISTYGDFTSPPTVLHHLRHPNCALRILSEFTYSERSICSDINCSGSGKEKNGNRTGYIDVQQQFKGSVQSAFNDWVVTSTTNQKKCSRCKLYERLLLRVLDDRTKFLMFNLPLIPDVPTDKDYEYLDVFIDSLIYTKDNRIFSLAAVIYVNPKKQHFAVKMTTDDDIYTHDGLQCNGAVQRHVPGLNGVVERLRYGESFTTKNCRSSKKILWRAVYLWYTFRM
jgi:hypothetical protein